MEYVARSTKVIQRTKQNQTREKKLKKKWHFVYFVCQPIELICYLILWLDSFLFVCVCSTFEYCQRLWPNTILHSRLDVNFTYKVDRKIRQNCCHSAIVIRILSLLGWQASARRSSLFIENTIEWFLSIFIFLSISMSNNTA